MIRMRRRGSKMVASESAFITGSSLEPLSTERVSDALQLIEEALADAREALQNLSDNRSEVSRQNTRHTTATAPSSVSEDPTEMRPVCADRTERFRHSDEQLTDASSAPSARHARKKKTVMTEFGGFVAPTLPISWPTSIPMHRMVTDSLADASSMYSSLNYHSSFSVHRVSSEKPFGSDPRQRCWLMREVQDPWSRINVFFECFGLVVLTYDLTVVPFELAWDMPPLAALSYISLAFWTLDLTMSCFRGYFKDGELVTDLGLVMKRYLRGWLMIDFTIVACELVSLLISAVAGGRSENGGVKVLRVMRLAKVLRLVAAVRILRFARGIRAFLVRSLGERHLVFLRVALLALAMLWMNHIVCCAWYAIGRNAPSDSGFRWTNLSSQSGGQTMRFLDNNIMYQYLTALHWSIAQTTLGSMEVTPATCVERGFNILILLLGFFLGSTLISTLSATMVEVQVRGRDQSEKLWRLRRYLTEGCVGPTVARRVQQQVTARLSQQDKLMSKDVHVLELLSPALRQELHAEVCAPGLIRHPLMRIWRWMDSAWFAKFCFFAVDVMFVRAKDDVFNAGSRASRAYFLMTGLCEYYQEPSSSPVLEKHREQVILKSWMAESTLCSEWIHVGTAEAQTQCQLLTISPDSFWESLRGHLVVRTMAAQYCDAYHGGISAAVPPHSAWPTDLTIPGTDFGDIVCFMSDDMQQRIGLLTLQHAGMPSRCKKLIEKLKTEVTDGRSVVIPNGMGQLERVVSVAVLQLEHPTDSKIFAKIATCVGGISVPDCVLPAIKRQRNELASEALERLFDTKLMGLKGQTSIGFVETSVEEMVSDDYGVRTRYFRELCRTNFEGGEIDGPICLYCDGGSRNMSKRSTASSQSELRDLSLDLAGNPLPVYYFQEGNKGSLYTWLLPEDFQRLSDEPHDAALKKWVRNLRPPAEELITYPI